MDDAQSLFHSKWDYKYHIVWVPKCRRKVLYGRISNDLAECLHELARQKAYKHLEGHLCSDDVHMLILIPPKYSVAQLMGFTIPCCPNLSWSAQKTILDCCNASTSGRGAY